LRETHLLCDALGFDASKLLKPDLVPWYVVRRETALATLKEVQNGSRKTERLQKRHKHMMDMNIYHYVPLEEEYAREGEREGKIYPGMRSYLFEVARASEEDVSTGLDSHPGEEVVLVTEGELEFWYRQPSDGIDRSLLLRPGDCIHYSSELPHGYRAAGKTDAARALFVFADPRMSIPSDITTSATSDEE
jgi:mannose-6-phosphate isomerase-like protein (cupin superfamily)